MDFYITDVFGLGKYSGNQLATFLHSKNVDDHEMQQIAREINFSETTFIMSEEPVNGGYDVRIFTPAEEVKFAGHPTLGTAFVIREYIIRRPVERVVLNLKAGQVPVEFPEDGKESFLWMHQIEPEFGSTFQIQQLAEVLNLSAIDFDERWPIQEVSTGMATMIVPLRNLDALKRSKIDDLKYRRLVEPAQAKNILVFCPGGYDKDQTLGVRVFAGYYGIPEDPATGSGNGCLAAYLVKQRYFGSPSIDIRLGQGYEIGRPSLIGLQTHEEEKHIHVSVGGRVITIAKGQW